MQAEGARMAHHLHLLHAILTVSSPYHRCVCVSLSRAAVSVAGLLPLESTPSSLPRVTPAGGLLHLIADLSDDDGT